MGQQLHYYQIFFDDLDFVTIQNNYPGVLQRINSLATRSTSGCPNKCSFCGVKTIEPKWIELEDWPDLPVYCDNNILAASQLHFDKVCDKLEKWKWCDFNQGIDARLLTDYHAERLKRIGKPIIRLAFDNDNLTDIWMSAYEKLIKAKISKSSIRSYILIGYDETPEIAWKRCKLVESFGVLPLPMWYHSLTALELNTITPHAKENGWTKLERTNIFGWFYKRRKPKGKFN